MKTSNATQKIKEIKSRLATRYFISVILFVLLTSSLLFLYLSSQYFSFKYCIWIKEHLSFLFYFQDKNVQLIINIASSIFIILINIIFLIIIYYIYSVKYQKIFLYIFFDELKLNEIYLLEQRNASINSMIAFSNETMGLVKMNEEHLFSIKSLFNFHFTQMFSKDHYITKGLLISSETNKFFEGFVEFRFEDNFHLEEIENKGLYKFIINKKDKYPYPLFINTNLGILTSKVFNDSIVEKLYDLRNFTRSNFSLCLYKNKLYIYLENWELRITDSFRKKLTYNSIDKKIDSFTRLVDDLQDLYICILRNYEVIKYGK